MSTVLNTTIRYYYHQFLGDETGAEKARFYRSGLQPRSLASVTLNLNKTKQNKTSPALLRYNRHITLCKFKV